MKKKLSEELDRIQFLFDYDRNPLTEQKKGLGKLLYKINKAGEKYSPVHFEKGDNFDIKFGRTRNYIDTSRNQQGGSDEFNYEDNKLWDASGHEEQEFGSNVEWKIGKTYISDDNLFKLLSGDTAQNCVKGMKSAMDSQSIANFDELIDDKKSVRFVFETINVYNQKYCVDCLTPKKGLKIIVGDNSWVETVENSLGDDTQPEDYQVPMTLPVASSPDAKFFKDNSSELEQLFITEVDGMIKSIKDQMSKMIDPKVYLSYLSVMTSASRLRNTKDAVDKTWSQLSQERANSARNYVITRLDEIGVKRDKQDDVSILTEYKIDFSGKNGDGSSGPNPEKPYMYNTNGKGNWYCGDNTEEGKNCKNTRNSKGSPESIDDLEKNKYLIVHIAVIFKAQKEKPTEEIPDDEPEDETVKKGSYNVKFILPSKKRRFKFWLPQITIEFGRRKKNPKETFFNNPKNWGAIKCFYK